VTSQPLAIVDVGSNSARLVIAQADDHGCLEVIEEIRAPLRLVRGLDKSGALTDEAMERAFEALTDFRAVARGAGVEQIVGLATAAVREASNRNVLLDRIREQLGIDVEVIDGAREAQLAFVGAIYGLPVEHGILMDMGGGSMQIARFRDRKLVNTWTFPLGALRLSDQFLRGDPPSSSELQALREYVQQTLQRAGVGVLAEDEELVGTGGTIRNLSRIDRRIRHYPIARVHAYQLSLKQLREVVKLVSTRRASARATLAGLNEDRVDSIVGGAVAVQTVMEHLEASDVMLSGQGLREGLAHTLLAERLPSPSAVHWASLSAIGCRFTTWTTESAGRRRQVAEALFGAVDPQAPDEAVDALAGAAWVLDAGRAIDYYRRHRHAAEIVLAADLAAIPHRGVALLAATLAHVGEKRVRVKQFEPLLSDRDRGMLGRLTAILEVAEEIERRCPPDRPVEISCHQKGHRIIVTAPMLGGSLLGEHLHRFRRATGLQLKIEGLECVT
jgi:exopolyphosphatase / guanosine-5'-triphosphate,3'-diphosphate pyrophosphatase